MDKRILVFSFAYMPHVGGAELALKEISKRAPDTQFDILTFRFKRSEPKTERSGNTTIYRIGSVCRYLYPFFAFFKAVRLRKSYEYPVVWSIMANYAGFAALFYKIKFPRTRFVLTLQEGDPIKSIKRKVFIVYPLFKKIFTKADKVHAISSYLADFAKDMGHLKDVVVIPNGVDIKEFGNNSCSWPRHSSVDVKLITTSRLVKKNAIGDIIESLRYLPKNFSLDILGSGPDKAKLIKLAERNNINSRVKFLGYIDHSDMKAYLNNADIYVRPSLSEGLGSSFLEAMAACLPVIATPVGGITDLIDDGRTGFFCKPSDPVSIAEKIKYVADKRNVDNTREVIQNAKMLINRDYDWSIVSGKMMNVLIR